MSEDPVDYLSSDGFNIEFACHATQCDMLRISTAMSFQLDSVIVSLQVLSHSLDLNSMAASQGKVCPIHISISTRLVPQLLASGFQRDRLVSMMPSKQERKVLSIIHHTSTIHPKSNITHALL